MIAHIHLAVNWPKAAWAVVLELGGVTSALWLVVEIRAQDPVAIPFRIVKLTGLKSPKESDEAQKTKPQRHRYQNDKHFHQRNLNAFKVTIMEEPDIANAAAKGVANPARARGTAITL